jgi:hypothetical protein
VGCSPFDAVGVNVASPIPRGPELFLCPDRQRSSHCQCGGAEIRSDGTEPCLGRHAPLL